MGDPPERLKEGIDFEIFRPLPEERPARELKGEGGRPPYGYILMFKMMILQRYCNLSDEQAEYRINGRMSFLENIN